MRKIKSITKMYNTKPPLFEVVVIFEDATDHLFKFPNKKIADEFYEFIFTWKGQVSDIEAAFLYTLIRMMNGFEKRFPCKPLWF